VQLIDRCTRAADRNSRTKLWLSTYPSPRPAGIPMIARRPPTAGLRGDVAGAKCVQGLVHPWRREAFRRSIKWIRRTRARPQPIVATVSQHQGESASHGDAFNCFQPPSLAHVAAARCVARISCFRILELRIGLHRSGRNARPACHTLEGPTDEDENLEHEIRQFVSEVINAIPDNSTAAG
jgi:hypothetical protein